MLRCSNCKKNVDIEILKCPQCGNSLFAEEVNVLGEVDRRIESLSKKTAHFEFLFDREQLFNRLRQDFWKRSWQWVVFIVSVSGLIFGFSIWGLNQRIVATITEKFADPKIEATFRKVVENKGVDLLTEKIQPAIDEMNNVINRTSNQFQSDVTQLHSKFENEYLALKGEVDFLKKRNEITLLADEVRSSGQRESYRALQDYANSSDPRFARAAKAEIVGIKTFFATMTRIKKVEISVKGPLGVERKNDEIPTSVLLSDLKNSPEWPIRARVATLLASRHQKAVPDALADAIANDPCLDVVKLAADSFQSVTGFESADVFGEDGLLAWWNQNKERIRKELKD